MPDDKFGKAIKYYEAHKDELRSWVLLNNNYGGGKTYERFIITHSFRRAREIVQGMCSA